MAMQDRACRPPVDPELVAQLVDGRASMVSGDELSTCWLLSCLAEPGNRLRRAGRSGPDALGSFLIRDSSSLTRRFVL